MQFLKDFLINLAFLALIMIGLFIAAPDMMRQVVDLLGGLFGPILILIVLVRALPKRRRSRSKYDYD